MPKLSEHNVSHGQTVHAIVDGKYEEEDAALYTAASLKNMDENKQLFISLVPMTIKEAQNAVLNLDPTQEQCKT